MKNNKKIINPYLLFDFPHFLVFKKMSIKHADTQMFDAQKTVYDFWPVCIL